MPQKPSIQSGGVNINRSTVNVAGDIVARDKISQSSTSPDLPSIEQQFARIYCLIDARDEEPNIDKETLRTSLSRIEAELKKGDAVQPQKVENWLRFLAGMADDIFEVTVTTLSQPIAGVAKVIQLIAKRVHSENTA